MQKGLFAFLALSATIVSAQVYPPACTGVGTSAAHTRRNIILFVPAGLRAAGVDAQHAPALRTLASDGVNFTDSHAVFPTLSAPNAAALLTGHLAGDTGAFGPDPFAADDAFTDRPTSLDASRQSERTVIELARNAGFATAVLGELDPRSIREDRTATGAPTALLDVVTDATNDVRLDPATHMLLRSAGLATVAPNTAAARLVYFTDVATKALLPFYAGRHAPFMLVLWSSEPADAQYHASDSGHRVSPGINSAASLAGLRAADTAFAALRAAVAKLGLADSTDIIVASDHGFSTISHQSRSSYAARPHTAAASDARYGFLALDIAHGLQLPLFAGATTDTRLDTESGASPPGDITFLGADPRRPQLAVVAAGGSDEIYLLGRTLDHALAARIVALLSKEDYTSGIFIDDRLGTIAGTLPLSAVNLVGAATSPRPSLIVNFRSFVTDCDTPARCTVEVADTHFQQGQGISGGLNCADTTPFIAAFGPDFRHHTRDQKPVSTADVGVTIAELLGVNPPHIGNKTGRVMTEALHAPAIRVSAAGARIRLLNSKPAADGRMTVLREQRYGTETYVDAAGYLGRTAGL